jgi:hypothetical protein
MDFSGGFHPPQKCQLINHFPPLFSGGFKPPVKSHKPPQIFFVKKKSKILFRRAFTAANVKKPPERVAWAKGGRKKWPVKQQILVVV